MRIVHLCCVMALGLFVPRSVAAEPPVAWIRFSDEGAPSYDGVPYRWLGDGPIHLVVDVPVPAGSAIDLLWGAKDDRRAATVQIGDTSTVVQAGGYRGFEWQRVPAPDGPVVRLVLRAAPPKPAFLAAVRIVPPDTPLAQPLPDSNPMGLRVLEPPLHPLDAWREALTDPGLDAWRRAAIQGLQAHEALRRCRLYVDGWLAHADPSTGLIPRNLGDSKHFWNGRDAGADNYAFMVLTCALTDRAMYEGRMREMLSAETRLATRFGTLPADFDFTTQTFRHEHPDLNRLIFDGSEYVKDGLMPITEWLGSTPWSARMIGIVDAILEHAAVDTPAGRIPSDNVEVNGEMMQVLSRLFFMTGDRGCLDMACRIADTYLLGDRHPTRDADTLGLRDHNCELISGLTEVYAACHFARREKVPDYRGPIHRMLDDILRVGINEHGLMFDLVNPQSGAVLKNVIGDNWGYNYNGFYTVYLLDGMDRYRDATRHALASLKPHYWRFAWQGWGSDGIADSVEGAINLLNREPDVPGVPEWIDANMARMLLLQKSDGVIEGWHGDGNYARTAILWALWKQQGLTLYPWREGVRVGAVREGDELHVVLAADAAWEGMLRFDVPRHRTHLNLPMDYPRINQFPEWFTVEADAAYSLTGSDGDQREVAGRALAAGIPVVLSEGGEQRILVRTQR